MSNKPGFFRQLKDTQNYSTKFLIVLFSPNSGVTPTSAIFLQEVIFKIALKHGFEEKELRKLYQVIKTQNSKNKNTNQDNING